jgi:DNA-binding transcriptional ArsR family regulator
MVSKPITKLDKGVDGGPLLVHNRIVLKPFGYVMTPSERLDATFMALADPTRRAILARLAEGEASVTELAAPFDMSQPAISKHLKVLERAGLVSRSKDAQRRLAKMEAVPLGVANDWLEKYRQYWEQSYQRLDGLLERLQADRRNQDKKTKE